MKKNDYIKIKWERYSHTEEGREMIIFHTLRGTKITYEKIFREVPIKREHYLTIKRNKDNSFTLWVNGDLITVRKERWQILAILDDLDFVNQEVINLVEKELYPIWCAD